MVNFMTWSGFQFFRDALRAQVLELWKRTLRVSRRAPKQLRLRESLPLGERRFVAVVEFEKERFLLGGTSSSLVLLSRLADSGGASELKLRKKEDEEEVDALWDAGAKRLTGGGRGGRC
jgi:flagellar biogenesis protein FliO